MLSTTKTAGPPVRPEVPWTTDLVIGGAAVICAMVMWLSAVQVGGVDLVVAIDNETRHIRGISVALSAAAAALVGLIVLRGLERFSATALRTWTLIALAVATFSALGPLSAASADAKGTLLGLHGVVAAVVIVGARRSRRSNVGATPSAESPGLDG